MRIQRTPLLNIYEQQLNNPICEDIYEKENNKEYKLTSEEDINKQLEKTRQIITNKID